MEDDGRQQNVEKHFWVKGHLMTTGHNESLYRSFFSKLFILCVCVIYILLHLSSLPFSASHRPALGDLCPWPLPLVCTHRTARWRWPAMLQDWHWQHNWGLRRSCSEAHGHHSAGSHPLIGLSRVRGERRRWGKAVSQGSTTEAWKHLFLYPYIRKYIFSYL